MYKYAYTIYIYVAAATVGGECLAGHRRNGAAWNPQTS